MGLEKIRKRMATAETRAGRPEGSDRLIAISKMRPLERVEAVLEAGHRAIGENTVQEAAIPALNPAPWGFSGS